MEKGKERRLEREGYLPQRNKGLPLDGEETDTAHREVTV